jgi:hypothetical protein
MAQIIGMQNAGQATSPEAQGVNGQPNNMGGVQGAPQQPQDLGVTGTGGGNIGIGNVPNPGESEFSGTPGVSWTYRLKKQSIERKKYEFIRR